MKEIILVRKLFVALSVLALGLLTACGSSAGQTVGAEEFAKTVATQGVVVLDVRHIDEYSAGHIAGALNIDVEAPTFKRDIAALDKNATIAVYCHSGRRSANAVKVMADAGFTHLVNLDGGITAWMNAGLPLGN